MPEMGLFRFVHTSALPMGFLPDFQPHKLMIDQFGPRGPINGLGVERQTNPTQIQIIVRFRGLTLLILDKISSGETVMDHMGPVHNHQQHREGPKLLLAKVPDMIGRLGIFRFKSW